MYIENLLGFNNNVNCIYNTHNGENINHFYIPFVFILLTILAYYLNFSLKTIGNKAQGHIIWPF